MAVFSDSKITLYSLIEQIRRLLKRLIDDNWTIASTWIKAHAEITGNKRADHLAKQAAKCVCISLYSKVPTNSFLATLKQESLENSKTDKRGQKENNIFLPSPTS